MKHHFFFLILLLTGSCFSLFSQPCTTTNASGCSCPGGGTTCDLLPDITIADDPLLVTGSSGVIEYAQTGNGSNNGRLRISVSTPNIGFGPLEIRATQTFICGTDTFYSDPGTCPGGGAPRQLINQRVYRKVGNSMTYYDRPAGGMTYHPTHNHMHVDDWGVFTLRIQNPNDPNPLNWQIVGNGAKLGFCLMDYGTCSYYNGHCEDANGNVLTNGSFPNFGLGGGNYNCSPSAQGISSGYTDIYYQSLDGMWIDIPPGTCNGQYYIVVEVDPEDYFLEMNENNNVIAIPFTLTKQVNQPDATVAVTGNLDLCGGDSVVLTSNQAQSYLWSNGATTRSITVKNPGTFSVQITDICGTATSSNITVTKNVTDPIANDTLLCQPTSVTLTAQSPQTVNWYNSPSGGSPLHTGATYTTPVINASTTYYVESELIQPPFTTNIGPVSHTGSSEYNGSTYNGYQNFDVLETVVLKSVRTETNTAGIRTIELRNSADQVLQSVTVNIPSGISQVQLNMTIPPGTGYRLGTSGTTNQSSFGNVSPVLKRTSSNTVTYPYTVSGLMTVTGSSGGASFWYYFYNWEIEKPGSVCYSARVPVQVIVSQEIPMISLGANQTLVSTPGNAFQWFQDGVLIPNATGQNFVPAQNGDYTVQVTGTDGCVQTSAAYNVNWFVACLEATGLNTTNIRPTSARLVWTPVSGAHHYSIRGRIAGLPNWVYLNVNNGSTGFLNISGLQINTNYEWQIIVYCNASETLSSAWSQSVFFTTGCFAPTGLQTLQVTANSAILSWTGVYGVAGYEIKGRPVGATNFATLLVAANFTNKAVYGLNPNTAYEWRVRAWCDQNGTVKSPFTDFETFYTLPGGRLMDKADDLFNSENEYGITVAPNPFSKQTKVSFPNPENRSFNLSLRDIAGKQVYLLEDIRTSAVILRRENLAQGVYFLELTDGASILREKIVISD